MHFHDSPTDTPQILHGARLAFRPNYLPPKLVLRGQHFETVRVYLQRHGATFSNPIRDLTRHNNSPSRKLTFEWRQPKRQLVQKRRLPTDEISNVLEGAIVTVRCNLFLSPWAMLMMRH